MAERKIIFWGSPEFSLPCLQLLAERQLVVAVVTKPEKPQGRGLQPKPSPIESLATSLQLPVLTPASLKGDFGTELKKYLPATFLVVAYGKIIPQNILDLSELPVLNIHPSLLPKFRGPSPIQSALLTGLTETGISLMQLDKEMDHGPIVAQEKIAIADNDYLPRLHDRLALAAAQLIDRAIEDYLQGTLKGMEQDHEQASYCALIKKEQGAINWQEPATGIRNKIRAFTPWPSCYFSWQGKSIKITQANVVSASKSPDIGILYRQINELRVNCGQDALTILKLQPEGKREMSAQEFLNGYQV